MLMFLPHIGDDVNMSDCWWYAGWAIGTLCRCQCIVPCLCCLVWSRSGCNVVYNAIGGMYNAVTISAVKLIVYIHDVGKLHSLWYNEVVMLCNDIIVWFSFARLVSVRLSILRGYRALASVGLHYFLLTAAWQRVPRSTACTTHAHQWSFVNA